MSLSGRQAALRRGPLVTKDGKAWGLTGCPDNGCDLGTLDSADAIDVCKTRNGGRPCLIFAHQDKIVVPYEIVN